MTITATPNPADPPALPIPAGDRPPLLVGDHPAMHLLNSRAIPAGREVEWIGDGEALRRWLLSSAVGFGDIMTSVPPSALDEAAEAARGFREWFRGFVAAHAGRPLDPPALGKIGPLNDLLREGEVHRAIALTGRRPAWTLIQRQTGARVLLQPLATAVGDLLCEADFTRIRRCEGPGCTLWFLDRTKGGKRRWCSMAICGNRAKASLHRSRSRGVRALSEPPAPAGR